MKDTLASLAKYYGFTVDTQVLLDSLGVSRLDEASYAEVTAEIMRVGFGRKYG